MQTSVPATGQPVGFPGLEADSGLKDFISAFSEEATAQIPFGVAVKQGTAPQGALMLTSSGDAIKGVASFGYTNAPGQYGTLGTTGVNPLGGKLRLLRKGRIWVIVDAGVSSIAPWSDRPFVRYSTNGSNTQVGAFSNATDSGHNTDLSKLAVFASGIKTASDGSTKIAIVEFDFTVKP